jgi:phosphomethylpyrimidine synthase
MNTRSSGSARVDSTKWLPSGEIRGLTKLVKITEDVRKYAAEQGLAESEALESGMQEKRKEFLEKGAEIYAKT